MLAIVDYGMGNLGSIRNMLKKLGVPATISAAPEVLQEASKLILPGVGAFDTGMAAIRRLGLTAVLDRKVRQDRVPVLGICLGMQLMTRGSSEGAEAGLGWIDASCVRFETGGTRLKVPHMGWNVVQATRPAALWQGMEGEQRFYFVHSYYVRCDRPDDCLLRAAYGVEFDAGFQRDNIMGVQFHPEKSHKFGMRLLKNFADLH
jgi:imidazole glycerol-phosphate synthase subunit HisH